MGTSGSAPEVSPEETRGIFSELGTPHRPLTTGEVADELDCSEGAARRSLEALVERGALETRDLDGRRRVWWATGRDGDVAARQSDLEEFGAFVRAVEDYAIFTLDPDGTVATWNEGAERIKGYEQSEIVGEHFSTFYTADDVADGVPERNLEVAASEGRVEDEGWRVRADGERFYAHVLITAIRDDEGELRGFTKVTRDMTAQREYEQRLRRERDLVDQVLETVPVSIAVIDDEGTFVRANRRMLDRIGIESPELEDYSVESWDVYDADGEPVPVDEWPWTNSVERNERVEDFECQVDVPDLGRRWLSMNAAPIEVGDHGAHVVVSVDDITDQKAYEQELRRERDQTEKLLRTAPIAIAVQDADGETVLANRRAQEALGLTEQEIITEPDEADEWEVYDADGVPLAPDETPSARALATGEPQFDDELVFDPPDGDRMHFRVNAAPLFDSEGEVERVVTAGEEITELKQRERQLERRKSELETELSEIFDRVSDAFYALDDEWRFTHVNDQAAEIMQHSREELLGREIWDVFPDATDSVYWEQFTTAMETQESVSFEEYADWFDGWLEVNAYPSDSGLSIYFRDVTERKRQERKLKESNERLEQFAYAASHDLQEPLRMVSSYLQLIDRRYGDELDEDGREFIEFAVDGADRMRDMIQGLLQYSRVETRGDSFESVDLEAVLADVRDDLQVRIQESDAEITADPLPAVQGDGSQLRQVFQNLLTNAIEFSGDDPPRIHVGAERDGSEWVISVRDEGIGIDPDDADRIFEVFQSLHTRNEHEGTGIGLALCERIVERHDGDIWVESEPGNGSTFFYTLPAEGEHRD